MIVINSRITIPREELALSFARSSGPGGQNVNKVNSKVTVHWRLAASAAVSDDIKNLLLAKYPNRITKEGELFVKCQETRDQGKNLEICYEKIRELVVTALTPRKKRRPTKPTKGSQQRRLADKKRDSQKKQLRTRRADD